MRALMAVVTIAIAEMAWAEDTPPPQASGVPVTPEMIQAAIGAVDGLVADVMARTGVPGIAVAVVQDGKVALAKGYGVREAGKPEPVDAETVFQLASVSKSVAATVVAAQVGGGEGRLGHADDELLPWFALSDPWRRRW